MKLLCLSDLHGDERRLCQILRAAGAADVLLLGGDLTNFGTPNQAEKLIGVAREHCPVVMAVAGNCDSPEIDQRLVELDVSLFQRGVVYQGVGFCGVSAMPPWLGNMYELTEEQIAAALEAGSEQASEGSRQVVLSHPPPFNCRLDRTRRGAHVGTSALRDFIERRTPELVICGHIHEARGIERLGDTTVVNCGPAFQGSYAVVELAETVHGELRMAE
jgi:Icc-related predicted phosphoesterase